jgi:hypothetical protein
MTRNKTRQRIEEQTDKQLKDLRQVDDKETWDIVKNTKGESDEVAQIEFTKSGYDLIYISFEPLERTAHTLRASLNGNGLDVVISKTAEVYDATEEEIMELLNSILRSQ